MIEARIAELTGAAVVSAEPVLGRGYTAALRLRVRLEDGRRLFAKAAVDDDTATWLREEYRIYGQVEAPFLPKLLAWQEADLPLLLLEDLSNGFWPPPWSSDAVAAVRAALDEVAATPPPPNLPSVVDLAEELTGWSEVAADPGPFLSTAMCSRAWLAVALPALHAAADRAPIAGGSLLHLDVRSDNLCIFEGRARLVDWNWACVGNPLFDLAAWLPSLHLEGGPQPEEVIADEGGEFAALLAGFWAARAGLPPPPHAAPRLREMQRAQGAVALAWAARALGLPPPDA